MTWQLALANIMQLPVDTRTICAVCGYKFIPPVSAGTNKLRVKYCCEECKEIGTKEVQKIAKLKRKLKRKQDEVSCV